MERLRTLVVMAIVAATIPPLGCDIGYGVRRSARLAKPLDVSCVARALEQVPGITEVDHRHVEPNACSWPHPTDTIDQFVFSGDKIWGVVSVSVAYDQAAELSMYHMQLNQKPPQDVIDRTRKAMDAAAPLLKQECRELQFTSELQESCSGVVCETDLKVP